MSIKPQIMADELRGFAQKHGIDKIGWFKRADFPLYLQAIESREEYGRIKYRSLEKFRSAAVIPEQFRAVVVMAVNYKMESDYSGKGLKAANYCRSCWQTLIPKKEALIGFLHGKALKAEALDLPARAAACMAGLGFIGKNTMFYADGIGSYVGIMAIGIDADLEKSNTGTERICHRACTNCSKCIDACPTRAIDAKGYAINPLKCISMLNRHADEPEIKLPDLPETLDKWLLGCEKCQEVCPLNRRARHKNKDGVITPELNVFGMTIPNTAEIPEQLVRKKMSSMQSPGYRKYVAKLLEDKNAKGQEKI
ncbi:MAG: 4Fe-4S double cluster binding domain-containing protein [Kiritimatiellae bacterium]|nr:4Fe-4S double cluster binding domain-containing protein [Kiritimatiellia bacterium]